MSGLPYAYTKSSQIVIWAGWLQISTTILGARCKRGSSTSFCLFPAVEDSSAWREFGLGHRLGSLDLNPISFSELLHLAIVLDDGLRRRSSGVSPRDVVDPVLQCGLEVSATEGCCLLLILGRTIFFARCTINRHNSRIFRISQRRSNENPDSYLTIWLDYCGPLTNPFLNGFRFPHSGSNLMKTGGTCPLSVFFLIKKKIHFEV